MVIILMVLRSQALEYEMNINLKASSMFLVARKVARIGKCSIAAARVGITTAARTAFA